MESNEEEMKEFLEFKRVVKERREKNELLYKEGSRKRLSINITKKMKTNMIGSLAIFEEVFGYLWGHGKTRSRLTNEEMDMDELWQEVRSRVLDRGNANIRSVEDEILEYDCTWNRYQVNFIVKEKGN